MELNLNILREDLPQWELQGTQADARSIARCKSPYFCSRFPEQPRDDVLYVIHGNALPPADQVSGKPSILAIGKPVDSWLTGAYNLMYTREDCSFVDLMNDINARFFFYADLEKRLQQCVDQRLPLRALAEVMGEVMDRPLFAQGSGFKVLFNYVPASVVPTPEYQKYLQGFNATEGVALPEESVNALVFDEEYHKAAATIGPAMFYSEKWDFPCLYLNIFQEQELIARITADEFPDPIHDRDYVLIQVLGGYLKKALLRERINPYDRPRDLDEILTKLLSHTLLPERRIASVLESFGWQMNDHYFCAVMELKERNWNIDTLNPVALRLSGELGSNCYTVFDNAIVFVCNLSKMQKTRKELINESKPTLRDNLVTASFSTVFRNFKDLYYFYQQAIAAGKLGSKKDPTFWYFKYEDYQNDYLLEQYTKNTIVETLIPQGLQALMDHDAKKGTNYVSLLKIYLDQERSIINTVRASYTSRSTFIYQIQRIQEILQMDLDDPEVRLLLMMVYRVLNKTNADH